MSEWKVDPDNRRRLLQLQKIGANKKCVDCNAPNPQWASPKFGIFICLECAGTHRSLGVHISFVRSITMDQFKPEELVRMEKGGNEPFIEYMKSHGIDLTLPPKIKYDNPIAQDYKDKLTCLVEGTEFVEPEHPDFDASTLTANANSASNGNGNASESENIPLENRRGNTPKLPADQKEKNEAYFNELGNKNQSKPDHLPPSQGGRYQGFGSAPVNNNRGGNADAVSFETLQTDPLGTLSKGWGLFSTAVHKSFDEVTESVIKPSYEQWQSGEMADETKRAAAQFGQKFQETTSYGFSAFSNFAKTLQDQYSDSFVNMDTTEPSFNNNVPERSKSPVKNVTKDEEDWEQF
ncbi:hypothetical protein TPHA_0H00900 [Tetrapisispora phaffii CBS 4417]|uniref:Arf-GAP domain-containing protein n=1 Tax=Tetrapisispora phaffii (strain ATCC 24235 / CBS 4417 / NBRC 1672 / NRRL Y-8282 / UCD 70-5) TaxID=1071381 RepID=G8BWZ4_TETPH|nr:hypothetical protein TPHA_0H00900 [Tetrapisispora phaffii CBS 4417]CCE64298.1 hypothetical protein TPHA_0H00900 [Tetrapisispora phaffii CBS 4417]